MCAYINDNDKLMIISMNFVDNLEEEMESNNNNNNNSNICVIMNLLKKKITRII